MSKEFVKMYVKKHPLKVAATLGGAILVGPVLSGSLILAVGGAVGGFLLGNKFENKKPK